MLEVKNMTTIKELRKGRGWSQMDLAVQASVTIGVIVRAETGKPISASSFNHICRALGVQRDVITGVNVPRLSNTQSEE